MKYEKLVEIEKLSESGKKLKITLKDGRILIGESWGIEPARDKDNEELSYDWLAFKTDSNIEYVLNEDVKTIEVV